MNKPFFPYILLTRVLLLRGPNGDGCAKFHGRGTKCKKQKGACKWVGKTDWDREGKCLPADGSEISVAYDASHEEKVGIRKSDARVFKVSVFLFCLLSITIFVGKFVHPKEAVTYKELSRTLSFITDLLKILTAFEKLLPRFENMHSTICFHDKSFCFETTVFFSQDLNEHEEAETLVLGF